MIVVSTQVMLIGDTGVGKTCLLVRFKDNAFLSGNFISTVGIDFRVRHDDIFLSDLFLFSLTLSIQVHVLCSN